jgi:hypothetical protein
MKSQKLPESHCSKNSWVTIANINLHLDEVGFCDANYRTVQDLFISPSTQPRCSYIGLPFLKKKKKFLFRRQSFCQLNPPFCQHLSVGSCFSRLENAARVENKVKRRYCHVEKKRPRLVAGSAHFNETHIKSNLCACMGGEKKKWRTCVPRGGRAQWVGSVVSWLDLYV